VYEYFVNIVWREWKSKNGSCNKEDASFKSVILLYVRMDLLLLCGVWLHSILLMRFIIIII
jgi:hypothetical protein